MAQDRYDRVAIAFHWALASLVLLNAGLALFRETFDSVAIEMISAHKAIGLAILALSVAWLGWRTTRPSSAPARPVASWEAHLARTVHRLLHALMIGVPAAGWIFTSLAPDRRPLDWRGGETVPKLPLVTDDAAAFFWHETHELMGFAMIGLVLLHICAAVWHQFGRRDNLLAEMIPWLKR